MTIFAQNSALNTLFEQHRNRLAADEGLTPSEIYAAVQNGTMVLLGNPMHPNLTPILVGQPARVKVNANIGTSPLCSGLSEELVKLRMAMDAGADTIMDLSIAGDLEMLRQQMLEHTSAPLGTVPLYAVAQRYLDSGREPETMDMEELFAEIERQAQQGVDFMTLHCGITLKGATWATDGRRTMGIVSRGGAILSRWMLTHKKENPLYEKFDRLLKIARTYNVTLSLGDGLRPGAGSDAGDAAQWEEVQTLGELAKMALENGVQCMIEGPGHVPMHEVDNQIQQIKKITYGSPLYVLGPLCIDSAPGYDHIASAIGGAIAVRAGADFLCYVTPAEHLTLPNVEDVRLGVMASRVAAQAGEVALGRPRALDREADMNRARATLDWDVMQRTALDSTIVYQRREPHKTEEECAMCGKFCAVKMLQEKKQ